MSRSAYKHFKNYGEPGEFVFITTTCLDFVHAFAEPEIAGIMAASLLLDCHVLGAELHAFVVMPHHIHAVLRLPSNLNCSQFIDQIKSNSARRIIPRLPDEVKAKFEVQRGLNRRTFWMRGFRSIVLTTNRLFHVKLRYTHSNPVRAGLAEREEDWFWSSARLRLAGRIGKDWALKVEKEMVEEFAPLASLEIIRTRRRSKPSTLAPSEEG